MVDLETAGGGGDVVEPGAGAVADSDPAGEEVIKPEVGRIVADSDPATGGEVVERIVGCVLIKWMS